MSWARKNAKLNVNQVDDLRRSDHFSLPHLQLQLHWGHLAVNLSLGLRPKKNTQGNLNWQWKILHLETFVSGFRKRLISSDRHVSVPEGKNDSLALHWCWGVPGMVGTAHTSSQSLRDDNGLANVQPRSIHGVYVGFSQHLLLYTFLDIPSFILTLCQWMDIDKTRPWIFLKLTRFFKGSFACDSVMKGHAQSYNFVALVLWSAEVLVYLNQVRWSRNTRRIIMM